MKANLFNFLFLTSITLLASCGDESSCGDNVPTYETYNLSADEKSKVPYTGTDTLIFVSNTNDTAILIGQGKKVYYEEQLIDAGPPDCSTPRIGKYEVNEMVFVDPKKILRDINIKLMVNNKSGYKILRIITQEKEYGTLISYLNQQYYLDTITSSIGQKINCLKLYTDNLSSVFYHHQLGITKIENTKTWLNQRY